jgi:hypothetical protein
VTPLPCSVADAGPKGVWQSISPPQIPIGSNNSGVPNVVANPLSPGEIYISTYQQGIYKSSDCGATWAKANTGNNASAIDSGTAWLFVIDPVTPQVLYADTFGGNPYTLYKTTNGGTDWDPLWPAGGVVAQASEGGIPELMAIDPTNHEHIITTIHANCVAPHPPLCFAESDDGGANWRIADGPTGSEWVEGAAPIVLGPKTFLLGSTWVALSLTTDDGQSWRTVSPSGGLQMIQANGWYYTSEQNGIQRSRDLTTWTSLTSGVGGEITYGLATDGTTLFVASRSQVYPGSYAQSPASDGSNWSKMPTPSPLVNPTSDGAYSFAIDTVHHILYSANQGSGLFRMVLQ